MQTRVDPPIETWLSALSVTDAVVATGHQASLWHPGIAAKLIAMHLGAERFGCAMRYLIVDQDVHDAVTLELPHVQGDVLSVKRVALARQQIEVPTGFQPSVKLDVSAISQGLLREALDRATGKTLAQQMTHVVMRLMEPIIGEVALMYVSEMPDSAAYNGLIEKMLHDAAACAQAYNTAIRETQVRDIALLRIEPERVELPLWACVWMQPRKRVFADLADRQPCIVFDDGELVDRKRFKLLPKALLLSAVMRSIYSNLFIHGSGGEVYDRATEHWWEHWLNKPLGAKAMATADLQLSFDSPLATDAQVQHAVWWRHHLPHTHPRKPDLLRQINGASDSASRASAFQRMHRLLAGDPRPLEQADADLARAQLGLRNAQIAKKRNWCVGLYPIESLQALRDTII